MWLWFVAASAALLSDSAHSDSGLSTTSFSNELRTGFSRLFQNGVEQPLQSPFVLLNPTEFQTVADPQLHRPAPFSPLAATGYHAGQHPRYELQYQSWVIPYYYVPTRFHPPRGDKRPNDVLVVVVKVKSNCTETPTNGTTPADGDEDGGHPDDDAEEVDVLSGGAERGKEPSRCVWAIMSCCAPANGPIRYTCFDVLGCSTALWNTNPCVPAILKAALDQANIYYDPITASNRTAMSPSPPAASPDGTDNAAVDLMAAITGTGASTTTAATPVADETTIAAATK